ncbi:MAG: NrsF family protein [Vicinamibacterales bacterium]
MNSAGATHQRLRRVVGRDLNPVRPLLAPARRLLLLLPAALLCSFLAPGMSPRRDIGNLGELFGWGLSAVEWATGLFMLGVAFREAVPGSGVPRRFLLWSITAVPALVALVTYVTYAVEPTNVPAGLAFRYWYECVLGPMIFGAPMLIAASFLALRAFPTRPAAVGALCGLAAGLLEDAGWRLACSVSAPFHVFMAHGLTIVLMAAIGSLVAVSVDRLRRSRSCVIGGQRGQEQH